MFAVLTTEVKTCAMLKPSILAGWHSSKTFKYVRRILLKVFLLKFFLLKIFDFF